MSTICVCCEKDGWGRGRILIKFDSVVFPNFCSFLTNVHVSEHNKGVLDVLLSFYILVAVSLISNSSFISKKCYAFL